MMDLKPLILVAATTRLATLIARDEITRPLREKVDEWALGAPYPTLPERVQTLVNCHRCVSVWAGAGVLAVSRLGVPGTAVLSVLALSQGAMTLIELMDKLSEAVED